MKVTANLPDELVNDLRVLSKKKTLTEAMILALTEWVAASGLREKHRELRVKPLEFEGISSANLREVNRRK